MNSSVKREVLSLFEKNLNQSRNKKKELLLKKKHVERSINLAKKMTAKNSQAFEKLKKAVSEHEDIQWEVLMLIKNRISKNVHDLKEHRKNLVLIQTEISAETIVLKYWNNLLNQVSPYKKGK